MPTRKGHKKDHHAQPSDVGAPLEKKEIVSPEVTPIPTFSEEPHKAVASIESAVVTENSTAEPAREDVTLETLPAAFVSTEKRGMSPAVKASLFVAVILIALALVVSNRGIFVAANVNGENISRFEVIDELERRYGKQVIDRIVMARLIEAEVKKAGIVIDDVTIDDALSEMEIEYAKQGQSLDASLASQGLSRAAFRDDLYLQEAIKQLLSDRVAITDEELAAFATENEGYLIGTTEEERMAHAREVLFMRKIQFEAQMWLSDLKAKTKVTYYASY